MYVLQMFHRQNKYIHLSMKIRTAIEMLFFKKIDINF